MKATPDVYREKKRSLRGREPTWSMSSATAASPPSFSHSNVEHAERDGS